MANQETTSNGGQQRAERSGHGAGISNEADFVEQGVAVSSKLRIFEPIVADGCELCHPIDSDDFNVFARLINGVSRNSTWRPIPMKLVSQEEGVEALYSDSPWLGEHALIFRTPLKDALGELLKANGELLPLVCSEADLIVFNATKIICALNENESTVSRFSGGQISWIKRFVFRPEVVDGVDIFKIPNLTASPTFLSERFVDTWNACGLVGLDFLPVWGPDG